MLRDAKRESSAKSDTPAIAPTACPSCGSRELTTTAKIVDASTYWRCSRCGEVWNAARREAGRRNFSRW